jgi:hypothetical protein
MLLISLQLLFQRNIKVPFSSFLLQNKGALKVNLFTPEWVTFCNVSPFCGVSIMWILLLYTSSHWTPKPI